MGQITIDQSHQVLATLAVNTDWNKIDFNDSRLQDLIVRNPKEAGRQFTAFLRNGGKFSVCEPQVIIVKHKVFNPTEFIEEGWTIIAEETDTRSTALTELDLTKVQFVTMLKDGESFINGEEKRKRLKKDGRIRLDANAFLTLWEKQYLIPESWMERVNGNRRFIYFDGTVLQNSINQRCVLCLFCLENGRWGWDASQLDSNYYYNNQSAVLANQF